MENNPVIKQESIWPSVLTLSYENKSIKKIWKDELKFNAHGFDSFGKNSQSENQIISKILVLFIDTPKQAAKVEKGNIYSNVIIL